MHSWYGYFPRQPEFGPKDGTGYRACDTSGNKRHRPTVKGKVTDGHHRVRQMGRRRWNAQNAEKWLFFKPIHYSNGYWL